MLLRVEISTVQATAIAIKSPAPTAVAATLRPTTAIVVKPPVTAVAAVVIAAGPVALLRAPIGRGAVAPVAVFHAPIDWGATTSETATPHGSLSGKG